MLVTDEVCCLAVVLLEVQVACAYHPDDVVPVLGEEVLYWAGDVSAGSWASIGWGHEDVGSVFAIFVDVRRVGM